MSNPDDWFGGAAADEEEEAARAEDWLQEDAPSPRPWYETIDRRLVVVGVHWQLFRTARAQALAGRQGPAAVRRLRSDLDRAYRLLEHGLGALEPAGSQRVAS